MSEMLETFESITGQDDSERRYGAFNVAEKYGGDKIRLGVYYRGDNDNGCDVAIQIGKSVESVDVCCIDPETQLITRYQISRPGQNGVEQDNVEQNEAKQAGFACGFVKNLKPGHKYFLRANRKAGHYAPHVDYDNELLDPYARAIDGDVRHDANGNRINPRCIVVEESNSSIDSEYFKPSIEHSNSKQVVYEAHVVGATANCPDVPEDLRGTYAGMGHSGFIKHLQELKVTTVQIMPSQQFVANEDFLVQKGLKNYWGYNTLGFFAPHADYSSDKAPGAQVAEFKAMVEALHKAGIKVVMDIVLNHTAEGVDTSTAMTFNGLGLEDVYHRFDNNSYANHTGCGNTVNSSDPVAQQTIFDSLRYWVMDMGIDGFRWDLITPLVREGKGGTFVNPHGEFMQNLVSFKNSLSKQSHKDITMIFEPWGDGYCDPQTFGQYGNAQSKRFRDGSRRFVRGEIDAQWVATMLAGAHEPLAPLPYPPVNFVTCHDGFTLKDVVSYNDRHNEANGEGGEDGEKENNSNNWGFEGETDDPVILDARDRARRALVSLLAVSRGIPMISGGDELSHTQEGNNNAYCQANDLTKVKWELNPRDKDFYDYFKAAFGLRAISPSFSRDTLPPQAPILSNNPEPGHAWLRADGALMGGNDYGHHHVIGLYGAGSSAEEGEEEGPSTIIYVNRGPNKHRINLAKGLPFDGVYVEALNSHTGAVSPESEFEEPKFDKERGMIMMARKGEAGDGIDIEGFAVIVLQRVSHAMRPPKMKPDAKKVQELRRLFSRATAQSTNLIAVAA